MSMRHIYEEETRPTEPDPDAKPISNVQLFTQPYDLVLSSLVGQIDDGTIYLRQLTGRPDFQRKYVWTNRIASRLIESILLNVPIPTCYLAQLPDYTMDVIDGQQRIFSIYRYMKNHFALTGLEVRPDLNGKKFFELPGMERRQIETHTLRCVILTNQSDPDIKFDVFERLNTNTIPLNAQELRHCISRGTLMDLLAELAEYSPWLSILGRRSPDNRMRDEELILRFFAFQIMGVDRYRTPQKYWLNDMANSGREYSKDRIDGLRQLWQHTIDNCLIVFDPHECFRRIPLEKRTAVNRALMDLTMYSMANTSAHEVKAIAEQYYQQYQQILENADFLELITRGVDHKSRTMRRFELWNKHIMCVVERGTDG